MPMKIQGNDYLKVVERLEMLVKSQKKDYSLETSFETINEHILIFKAVLTIDNNKYTGHSMCDIAEGKPKIAEKTETCAIGRALSSYGLHGGHFASADEMLDWQTQTQQAPPQQAPTQKDERPPSENQLKLITKLCNEHQLDFEKEIVAVKSMQEASDKIKELNAREEELQASFN